MSNQHMYSCYILLNSFVNRATEGLMAATLLIVTKDALLNEMTFPAILFEKDKHHRSVDSVLTLTLGVNGP